MSTAKLLVGVQSAWAENGTLTAQVPGGLREGRLPITGTDGAELKRPYARLEITEGDKEWFSGEDYLQKFTVAITVWDTPGKGAVEAARHVDTGTLIFDWGTVTIGGVRVVGIRPIPGQLSQDDRTREGKDVVMAKLAWEVTLQLKKSGANG